MADKTTAKKTSAKKEGSSATKSSVDKLRGRVDAIEKHLMANAGFDPEDAE